MYAVIVSGGQQYRVKPGQFLKVEKIAVGTDTTIKFEKILMVCDGENTLVGAPYLSGYTVNAEIISEGRGDKIRIIKFKRRKHHMKTMGHRQSYTEVKITGIQAA
jgi:large subunit ribosomal protein L21